MDEKKREPFIWFRPWRWPRWLRCTATAMVPLFFLLYLLSMAPAIYLARAYRIPDAAKVMMSQFYMAARGVEAFYPPYESLTEWQMAYLHQHFGDPDE